MKLLQKRVRPRTSLSLRAGRRMASVSRVPRRFAFRTSHAAAELLDCLGQIFQRHTAECRTVPRRQPGPKLLELFDVDFGALFRASTSR